VPRASRRRRVMFAHGSPRTVAFPRRKWVDGSSLGDAPGCAADSFCQVRSRLGRAPESVSSRPGYSYSAPGMRSARTSKPTANTRIRSDKSDPHRKNTSPGAVVVDAKSEHPPQHEQPEREQRDGTDQPNGSPVRRDGIVSHRSGSSSSSLPFTPSILLGKRLLAAVGRGRRAEGVDR
jgi:hypothetical protein